MSSLWLQDDAGSINPLQTAIKTFVVVDCGLDYSILCHHLEPMTFYSSELRIVCKQLGSNGWPQLVIRQEQVPHDERMATGKGTVSIIPNFKLGDNNDHIYR